VGGVADKDVGYRERLLTQAAGLGVAEAVVLEGRRDDVPDLMRGADLLALPSLSEGLPNAVLEAMAAGLPVVATAVGGCCELGENGRTLRLVPARDAGALAAAITALRRSAELRESLAEAARDFVAEHHSWERTVRELDELYAELLCRKSPRRARALGLVGAR
jgi:glycosyltransferase involved in cell wall biosynthesis